MLTKQLEELLALFTDDLQHIAQDSVVVQHQKGVHFIDLRFGEGGREEEILDKSQSEVVVDVLDNVSIIDPNDIVEGHLTPDQDLKVDTQSSILFQILHAGEEVNVVAITDEC